MASIIGNTLTKKPTVNRSTKEKAYGMNILFSSLRSCRASFSEAGFTSSFLP